MLGPEHPETLTSIANRALIYWNQGRWNGAEDLQMKAMESIFRVLSREHPDISTCRSPYVGCVTTHHSWVLPGSLHVVASYLYTRTIILSHYDNIRQKESPRALILAFYNCPRKQDGVVVGVNGL